MVCNKCGSPLMETDKFCQFCGTPVSRSSTPAGGHNNGGYTPNSFGNDTDFLFDQNAPTPPRKGRKKKKSKLPLIIGGVAAAVLVAALVIVLIVTGQPAVKVAAAFSSTTKELSQITNALSVNDLSDALSQDSMSMDMDVTILSVEGDDSMEGLGINMAADVNLGSREIGYHMVPHLGSVELCNLMLALEDEMIYFGMPEILPDPYYGIDTTTVIQDLMDLGAPLEEVQDLSFNFFELVELVQKENEAAIQDAQKAIEDASSALIGSLEVEKAGKRTLRIHGTETKCTVYNVTIPRKGLENLVEAYEDSLSVVDQTDMMELVLEEMGMPQDFIDEILYEMDMTSTVPDFSDLYDLLDELGNIQLDVCVSGGKISAVMYEDDLYDTEIELNLSIGGGDNYADDITLEISADGDEVRVESSGNHAGKGGVFSDHTVIVNAYGDEITMDTELETKGDGAFVFTLESNGEALMEMEGTIQSKSSSTEISLDELVIYDGYYGDEILSMQLRCSVGSYQKRVKVKNERLLSQMTLSDLEDIAVDVQDNAEIWIYDLMEQVPELAYMF